MDKMKGLISRRLKESTKAQLKVFSDNPKATDLDLSNKPIDMKEVCDFLQSNTKPISLNLSGCSIDDKGIKALVGVVSHNTNIETHRSK
jgi:hypothetical protein